MLNNELFATGVQLQSDVGGKMKIASEAKSVLDQAAFVQMVFFIAGNYSAKIKAKTKKAGKFQTELVETHSFPKRHAQTISSIALNKKICKIVRDAVTMVSPGIVVMNDDTLIVDDSAAFAQFVTDTLAANELTTINKQKAFIADPVDPIQKILEMIDKLDKEQQQDFDGCYEIYKNASTTEKE